MNVCMYLISWRIWKSVVAMTCLFSVARVVLAEVNPVLAEVARKKILDEVIDGITFSTRPIEDVGPHFISFKNFTRLQSAMDNGELTEKKVVEVLYAGLALRDLQYAYKWRRIDLLRAMSRFANRYGDWGTGKHSIRDVFERTIALLKVDAAQLAMDDQTLPKELLTRLELYDLPTNEELIPHESHNQEMKKLIDQAKLTMERKDVTSALRDFSAATKQQPELAFKVLSIKISGERSPTKLVIQDIIAKLSDKTVEGNVDRPRSLVVALSIRDDAEDMMKVGKTKAGLSRFWDALPAADEPHGILDAWALQSLALHLATLSTKQGGDGELALVLMCRAAKITTWNSWEFQRTAARACAAMGRFEDAMRFEEAAMQSYKTRTPFVQTSRPLNMSESMKRIEKYKTSKK